MIEVRIEPPAEQDLIDLYEKDPESADIILAVLEAAGEDWVLAETLTKHGYLDNNDPSYQVSRFQELWNDGLNLYRLKFWDYDGGPVPYRALYAHHPTDNRIHVLAIVNRDFNYDKGHPIVVRVINDYCALDLPTF